MNYKLILKVAGVVAVAVVAVFFCIGCSSEDEEDNYGTIYGTWVGSGDYFSFTSTFKRNGTFETSNTTTGDRKLGTFSTNGTTITTTTSDIYFSALGAALNNLSLIYSGLDGVRFSEGWYNRNQYRNVYLEGCKTASDEDKTQGVCANAERLADTLTTRSLGPTTGNYSVDGNTLTICPLYYADAAQCTNYTRQ